MSYCRLSLQHCRLECDLAGNVGIFRALPGVAVSVAVGGVTRAAINHRRAIELLFRARWRRDGECPASSRIGPRTGARLAPRPGPSCAVRAAGATTWCARRSAASRSGARALCARARAVAPVAATRRGSSTATAASTAATWAGVAAVAGSVHRAVMAAMAVEAPRAQLALALAPGDRAPLAVHGGAVAARHARGGPGAAGRARVPLGARLGHGRSGGRCRLRVRPVLRQHGAGSWRRAGGCWAGKQCSRAGRKMPLEVRLCRETLTRVLQSGAVRKLQLQQR